MWRDKNIISRFSYCENLTKSAKSRRRLRSKINTTKTTTKCIVKVEEIQCKINISSESFYCSYLRFALLSFNTSNYYIVVVVVPSSVTQ